MSTKAGDVARLLCQAQWLIDQAVYDIPADRYTAEDYTQLAELFEQLAALMRDHASRAVVIDVPSTSEVQPDG